MRFLSVVFGLFMLVSCDMKTATMEDFTTRDVRLPGGQIVHAEVMADARDLLRGMQFRKELAPDRGMLYVHRKPGLYGYWMYQTPLSLDMIWMDAQGTVVEIVENAPPCQTQASKCPHWGGHQVAQFVLQIAGGGVKRYGLKEGDRISF